MPLPLGADDRLRNVVLTALDLAGHAHDVHAVRELVVDGEVVVALAVLGLADHLPAAHADGPNGVGADGPAGHVQVVHVLLDDVVAAEPEEVVPVADLVFGVRPAGLALVGPDRALIPVDLAADDVADRSVVNSLQAFDVSRLMPALGAGDDGKSLPGGFVVGGQHLADAGAVNRDGLLGKEVLAGLDRRLDVLGTEAGRGRQHDQVAAVDDFLISVEADEAAIVGDVDLVLGRRRSPLAGRGSS